MKGIGPSGLEQCPSPLIDGASTLHQIVMPRQKRVNIIVASTE